MDWKKILSNIWYNFRSYCDFVRKMEYSEQAFYVYYNTFTNNIFVTTDKKNANNEYHIYLYTHYRAWREFIPYEDYMNVHYEEGVMVGNDTNEVLSIDEVRERELNILEMKKVDVVLDLINRYNIDSTIIYSILNNNKLMTGKAIFK